MSLISVIVPFYNAEKYLGMTLECLLAQTHKNLEIICVADAPTDGSTKIADDYAKKDARIRVIKHSKNMDLPAARNTGAKAASGEYIHFMDSDDLIGPDFYENMLASIKKENSDVAACNVYYEKKPFRSIRFLNLTILYGVDKIRKTRVMAHGWAWRWLIRRDFWNAHKFEFPDLVPMEDKPVMVPMIFFANSVALCPNATYFYKNRPTSILNGVNKDKIRRRHDNRVKARKIVRDFVRKHKICIGIFSIFCRLKI